MKNALLLLISIFSIIACKQTEFKNKTYFTLSGTLKNSTCDSIFIQKSFDKTPTATFRLQPNGSFKDTITIKPGLYFIIMGDFSEKLFFRNGYDIHIDAAVDNFYETVSITGEGAAASNYIIEYHKMIDLPNNYDLFRLSKKEFDAEVEKRFTYYNQLLQKKNYDSLFVALQQKDFKHMKSTLNYFHERKQQARRVLAPGKPSPTFSNYENSKGKIYSSKDFEGSYVLIDFWQTWCKPCIAEFTSLEKLIKNYNNNSKIKFVSINLNGEKYKNEWHEYVEKNDLKGIQLFATNEDFWNAYIPSMLPRYVLIDPEGNIVDADTFRPSDPKLIELFDSLPI